MIIPTPKSIRFSLHPHHWWISHNFVTYTISYHIFWIKRQIILNTIELKTPTNGRYMSNTAKWFPDFLLIIFILKVGLRLIGLRFICLRFIGIIWVIFLLVFLIGYLGVKSSMSASPNISSVSYQKVSSEHLKTRINDLYIYCLCMFSSKTEEYGADILKAVLIFLPIVFSQPEARRSAVALDLLEAGSISFDPRLRRRFPQENWDQLLSSSFKACKLAITAKGKPTIPEPDT